MAGTPLFSVVIPTCGRGARLRTALASVRRQTVDAWDCWIVNDRPEDAREIEAVVADFAEPRFRLLHNEANRGAAASSNTAIEASRGRILAFLDDDDEWLPNHLEGLQQRHAQLGKPALVYSQCILRWQADDNPRELRQAPPPPRDVFEHLSKASFYISTLSVVSISRKCLDDVGLFDTNLLCAYDLELYLRISQIYPFSLVQRWSVIFNQHPGERLSADLQRYSDSYQRISTKWNLGEDFACRKLTAIKKNVSVNATIFASLPERLRAKPRYDVAVIADFRFVGGTSSAVAEEIKASAAAGYRTALVHVEAPILTYSFPLNPKIRACVDQGLADLVDPDVPISACLALVHNPYAFRHMLTRPLVVDAEAKLLAVQHPPLNADGEPFYDCAAVDLHIQESLGGGVLWAPVGPLVREQFGSIVDAPPLFPKDWYNIVDLELWATARTCFRDVRPVIGRHSRPDRRKWPDTRALTLKAYPDDQRFRVRVLGGERFLVDLLGGYPRNWRVWPFGAFPPEQFLRTIDYFVYFHHSQWVEAFGCTIIEAMASGAVTVLPPHFRPLFGDAALYCEPDEVAERVLACHSDWGVYREQAERGLVAARERFSHAAHLRRLNELIGPPRATTVAARPRGAVRRPRRVLFFSSNGVGMGHLSRLLAIARRCPEPLEPVFATMSQAMRVAQDYGYVAEYIPDHSYLGCDVYRWNKCLWQEINELIAFYDAAVVVFDCNCPYQGLIDAIGDNPETWFIWCRRGMWRPGVGELFIQREPHFDAVLEPRDLAGAFDAGLTAQSRSRTRLVDPIRLLDDWEMLPREEARRELGLDPDRAAVLLQLGSGNNYDYDPVRKLALAHLARRDGVQVAVADWLMSDRAPDLPDGVLRIRSFPLGRWLHAFDLSVSAVGYNSYHELLLAGLPTVFVPNENPKQDDQLARARYAERHGLGLCVRSREVYKLGPYIDRLLDPVERDEVRRRCATLDRTNGALEAARMIEELAYIRRADRDRTNRRVLPSST